VAVAVLLASCSGGEPKAAGSHSASVAPSSSPGTTTGPDPSPKPTKPGTKPTKHPTPAPKPFRMRLESVRHTLTRKHMNEEKVRRAMKGPVGAIRQRFEGLFRATYIDPAAWRNAKYGPAIEKFFGGTVRPVAREHLRKLTLGPDAGKQFESVREPGGRLKITVLIGPGGAVETAAVRATFTEKAVRPGGRTTVVVSDGRYYLRPSKKGWVIEAFQVGRHDHPL
jgi:hypothetical protein